MFCFLGESEAGGKWAGPDQVGLGAAHWQVGGGGKISSKRPNPDQFDRFRKNLVVSEIQKSGNTGDLTLIKFSHKFLCHQQICFFFRASHIILKIIWPVAVVCVFM